ncbi:hypothetical protein SDC9_38736 [bioreactor metagenome]|uniref:Uncharacterized protein n=1 Tax=bioreactor metagenome TaxID=1076179 RepID=A0A644VQB3_9ZZZZ
MQRSIPREEDPGVLTDLGDEGVGLQPALGLGIDRGEMRLRVKGADEFHRFPRVDEIVDDQDALAIAHQLGLRRLDDDGRVLGLVVVALDRDRVDDADVQLARDDRRGHQPAAGDADDGAPGATVRPLAIEPPGQRACVAVELVPADQKALLVGKTFGHDEPLR